MNFEKRRTAVHQAMRQGNVDLLAVPPGPHMFYLLGWHPHVDERPCFLLLTGTDAALLMPSLNADDAQAHVSLPMDTYADADGPAQALERLARRLAVAPSRVLVDEATRFDFAAHLREQFPGARLESAAELLGGMRMHKDADEIAELRTNAGQADRAIEAGRRAMRLGAREIDVADAVAEAFAAEGARLDAAIVGFGPNAAYPHHESGERRLKSGDAVVIDIGAVYQGYHSDITRMSFAGEPDAEYLRVHAIVEQALTTAIAVARPGAKARDVDAAARGVIAAAGFGPYFTHRTGHGIGIQVHEPPYMTGTNELALEAGMTFSIEPGIYLPGRFGVRLEEIVVVREEHAEILSTLPRDVYRASAQED